MSTQQRSHACVVAVDPSLCDVLRLQTLVVLEVNHHGFESLLVFSGERQFKLSVIYRDAFAVLDAVGWSPDPDEKTVEVPLTAGHVDQLHRVRHDLGRRNLDLLQALDHAESDEEAMTIRRTTEETQIAIGTLGRIFDLYDHATRA